MVSLQKKIDFDTTSEKKLREHFKKFVKKWNSRKLPMVRFCCECSTNCNLFPQNVPWSKGEFHQARNYISVTPVHDLCCVCADRPLSSQKYYVGVDPLWAVSSPGSYSRNSVGTPNSSQEMSDPHDTSSLFECSQFGTFGKSTGRKVAEVGLITCAI